MLTCKLHCWSQKCWSLQAESRNVTRVNLQGAVCHQLLELWAQRDGSEEHILYLPWCPFTFHQLTYLYISRAGIKETLPGVEVLPGGISTSVWSSRMGIHIYEIWIGNVIDSDRSFLSRYRATQHSECMVLPDLETLRSSMRSSSWLMTTCRPPELMRQSAAGLKQLEQGSLFAPLDIQRADLF